MNIMPKPKSNFTIIQNDIFNNYPDMSAKSKFMLLQILSKPADWKLSLSWLAKQNNEGIHAVKSSVKEWVDNGFLHKFTARADGRIKEVVPVVCFPPLTREQAEVHFNVKYQQAQGQPEAKQVEPEIVELVVCDSAIDETETCRQKTNPVENHLEENHPLLNTDNNKNKFKQILRETTATPVHDEKEKKQQQLTTTVSEINYLLNLIPEQFASPMTTRMINTSLLNPSISVGDIADAIVYSSERVCGGRLQFKSYLDKMIQNGEAVGYQAHMDKQTFIGGFSAANASKFSNVFPNGSPTGSQRMDRNLAACLEFAALSKKGRATA